MQRGMGALGETVARFDTIEANTLRFGDGTEQSTGDAVYHASSGAESDSIALALTAQPVGSVRFYTFIGPDPNSSNEPVTFIGITLKDASGYTYYKQLGQMIDVTLP